jgi:hypothetical protein
MHRLLRSPKIVIRRDVQGSLDAYIRPVRPVVLAWANDIFEFACFYRFRVLICFFSEKASLGLNSLAILLLLKRTWSAWTHIFL